MDDDKLVRVMSFLEGLTQDDWREFHSDSEVQNIAKDAMELLKEQQQMYWTLEHDWKMLREKLKLDCN